MPSNKGKCAHVLEQTYWNLKVVLFINKEKAYSKVDLNKFAQSNSSNMHS